MTATMSVALVGAASDLGEGRTGNLLVGLSIWV